MKIGDLYKIKGEPLYDLVIEFNTTLYIRNRAKGIRMKGTIRTNWFYTDFFQEEE